MAVDVTLAPEFTSSEPRALFKDVYGRQGNWPRWDVCPDGQAFLMIQDFSQPQTAIRLVQNWFAEIGKTRQ